MDLGRYFSVRRRQRFRDTLDSEDIHAKTYLPLLASPINGDAREALSACAADLEKTNLVSTRGKSSATHMIAGNGRTSSGNIVIYKSHHEASSIELFYDLFFVANLAYFTAMHQHIDAQSLINYLKLFTLLWFTWLSTTLFDLGVFTGFVFAGPIFDDSSNSSDGESFSHFALVLVVSRACIAVQYAVVMWQGRMFRQTLVPLGLSTAIHGAAALAYAIILMVFRGRVREAEQIMCVAIAVFEGLAILFTAMIWRIISFKYTHIVERLQLLTLIIIGEGIIGMIKSVACITKGQARNNSTELGAVIAAVLLLYLIYMLYFDQFSEDRFGTLRQQMWSLLHYPLHMAIVICVEGNTSLIVWNFAVQGLRTIWSLECKDYSDPANDFNNAAEYIDYLNNSMVTISDRFRSKKWEQAYNWNLNITAIYNYTSTYGFRSDTWNNKTGDLVQTLFTKAQVFVFEAHAETLAKLNAAKPLTQAATGSTQQALEDQLNAIYGVLNVTVMSFYIGAGAILLVLAVLYWFNKMHKTKYEFGKIINRVVIGFALIIVGIAAVIGDKTTHGFKFKISHWMIAIVVLCFVVVLSLDNVLLAIARQTFRRNARRSRSREIATSSNPDISTFGLLAQHTYSTTTSRSPSRSAPLSRVPSTAYVPVSQPQTRIPAPSRTRSGSECPRGRFGASQARHDVLDFASQQPPHPGTASVVGQTGLAVSPPLAEDGPIRHQDSKGMERGRVKALTGFESGDWSDDAGSDGDDLRRLGRARTR